MAGYLRSQGSEDAEGLTNEVFLAAFRHLHNFRGGEPELRSWIFTIAHNRLIDERRRRARRITAEPVEPAVVAAHRPAPAADVESEVLGRQGTERVLAVLGRLAPDQRDVLLLRLVGDLTIDQISEVVRKQPGAVKALQRRGLAAIRRIFEQEGVPL